MGADVQQDGTQVGQDVFFGHVELWKGNTLSSKLWVLIEPIGLKCLTAYLTHMWSDNETYRGDLRPDVTFALHLVLMTGLKQL